MEQLSLFAVDTNDMSNVEMWGAEDFERFLKDGDPAGFERAMTERGFEPGVINAVLRANKKQWRDIIATALRLFETAYGSFVFGSSEEAVEANKAHALIREMVKSHKNTSMHEALYPLLRDHAQKWVGERVWQLSQYTNYESPDKWVEAVGQACGFIEQVDSLGAEIIKPSDIRLGDELITYWRGATYRGWIVKGTVKKWSDGREAIDYNMWIQGEDDKKVDSWSVDKVTDYQEWFSHNELTKELTTRYIRSFWNESILYRVGHKDDIKTIQVTKEQVIEALYTLPLPESPEKLWSMVGGRKDNWLELFFHDEISDFWHDYMKRYSVEDALRTIQNSSCKVPKRGSRYDSLPPDELIEPLVQKLIDATTFEEVELLLKSHYWITKEQYSLPTPFYRLNSISTSYGCYDPLYKSAMAQTEDRQTIIYMMQDFARNPHMRPHNVAKWSPEDGLQMIPFKEDMTEEDKQKHLADFEVVKSMTCLGIFDKTNRTAIIEEDEEEDNVVCDECDFVDDEDDEDEE